MISDLLQNILEIQEFDVRISERNIQIKKMPLELQNVEDEYNRKNKSLTDQKEKIKHLQAENSKLDLDVKSNQEKIDKFSTQLLSVKTNQEYKALEKEIFNMKTTNSRIEDQILEKMEEIDLIQRKIAQIDKEIIQEKEQIAQRKKEVDEKVNQLKNENDTDKTQRKSKAEEVDIKILKLYERILKRVGAPAIVEVNDRICGGCHIKLTPQAWSDLHRIDKINTCDTCSRIIYLNNSNEADSVEEEAHSAH